ncbi:MFS transporter [Curvibacter sp. HBC61]|uniref:MFS transporter n=1 Tax=Curvibacter cyanobacteriorum TaxID=3026422 RepID=A0ABT5MX59_9BURK|nr:MFS transporter [Curvibacter sp. HBC61]MDD0838639.1 MFS transporter [Curvibacter sp. HBC61]
MNPEAPPQSPLGDATPRPPAAPTPQTKVPGPRRALSGLATAYLVVLCGMAGALHVAKLAPAVPLLQAQLGLTLPEAGLMLSAVQIASMLLGAVLGLFSDRIGLRRCMLIGLLMLTLSSAAGPLWPTAGFMLACRALEGIGFLLVFMPGVSLIRQLVSTEQMPFMSGVWGTCMPLATALALLGGPLLLPLLGWPDWWWLMAALSAVMALLMTLGVPSDAARAAGQPDDAVEAQAGLAGLWLTLSCQGPWLVALSFAFYAAQWQAVMGFLPSIYANSTLGVGLTAVLTALAGAANILGNLGAGLLLQRRVPPARVLAFGFVSMAVGAWLAFEPFWPLPAAVRYLALLAFSMLGGLIPGSLSLLAVRLSPSESTISTTVGWMTQCSALGQFAGAPLVAWVAARSGGWQWTWVVAGVFCLGGLTVSVWVGRALARTVPRPAGGPQGSAS